MRVCRPHTTHRRSRPRMRRDMRRSSASTPTRRRAYSSRPPRSARGATARPSLPESCTPRVSFSSVSIDAAALENVSLSMVLKAIPLHRSRRGETAGAACRSSVHGARASPSCSCAIGASCWSALCSLRAPSPLRYATVVLARAPRPCLDRRRSAASHSARGSATCARRAVHRCARTALRRVRAVGRAFT
jgi:hypothetical protein